MALLRVVLLSCVFCTFADCWRENEDFRIGAPSVIRLCNNTQHKVLLCVICNGFVPTCFSASTPAVPTDVTTLQSTRVTLETVTTPATTTTSTTLQPTTAATTEPAE